MEHHWNNGMEELTDLRHLCVFRCSVHSPNKTPGLGRFVSKTLDGIFMGYSTTSNAYRVWVPSATRDIIFTGDLEAVEQPKDFITNETVNGEIHTSNRQTEPATVHEVEVVFSRNVTVLRQSKLQL